MPNPADYKYNQWKKAISIWQIEQLEKGVLLVRLSNKKKTIRALRQAGSEEKAAQIEKETEIMNLAIVQGFKIGFDFCSVFFFDSDYSDLVRAHKLNEIQFVDEIVLRESNLDLITVNFFVAEFAPLSPDTIRGKNSEKPGSGSRGQNTSSYSRSNLGISGLIIKSDQFVQLVDPFPYYVRTYATMSMVERSPVKSIAILNRKLHEFYDNRKLLTVKKKRNVRKAESRAKMK